MVLPEMINFLFKPKAADFTIQTKFVSPIFQLDFDANPFVEALNYRLYKKLGFLADALALETYDALWLGTLALMKQQEMGMPDVKDAFLGVLPQYRGYTQVIRFNANGDRYTGMYVFKSIEKRDATYSWQKNSAFVFITQDPGSVTGNPNSNPLEDLPVKNRLLLTRRPIVPAQGNYILPALVPLTGSASETNESALPSMKIAETDLNRYLEMYGSKGSVQLQVLDTKSDNTVTQSLLKDVNSQKNSRLVIGPYTSDAVRSVKDYADTNEMILLSPGSTAVSLSIANDNIYRLVMDDNKQADALSHYLEQEGIKVLIPIWIDNEYGNSLQSELRKTLTGSGKTVMDGVSFSPSQTDFSSVLKTVQDEVNTGLKSYSANTIGVVVVALDQGVSILESANAFTGLNTVRWFGSDSMAKISSLWNNAQAREFALKTKFTASYFAPELDLYVWGIAGGNLFKSYFENFLTRYQQEANNHPGSYTYSSYDAVWLTAMTNFQLTSSTDLKTTITIMRSTFNLSPGYNERNQFNDAGDKAYGSFGFAQVENDGTWNSVAAYHFSTDKANWLENYSKSLFSAAADWDIYQ